VVDLSFDSIRVFEFITPNGNVFVAWDADAAEGTRITDLSAVLGRRVVTVTPIVKELTPDNSLVVPEVQECDSTAIPLSITPDFIE